MQTSGAAFTLAWSGNTTTLIGATAQNESDGQANTNAIIADNNTADKAATVCDDYVNPDTGTGVYSDWYLPSVSEMRTCYDNKGLLNFILGLTNGFKGAAYSTSTEFSATNNWFANFNDGNTGNLTKSTPIRVRAVRRF
jgi:hypothetical protein